MSIPCGHYFEVVTLDGNFKLQEIYNEDEFGAIAGVASEGQFAPLDIDPRHCPACIEKWMEKGKDKEKE